MDSNILTEEKKQHIDSLGVYDLLSKVRFAPAGDPWMCGEVGAYWLKKLREKKEEDNAYYVKVSKEIGWKA